MQTSNKQENVVLVSTTTELPYAYIPYSTISAARVKYPYETLYVYEGKFPEGYKIVAVPVLMVKPEDEEDEGINVG